MELDEALTRISDIRRQMARTEVFRGYRSVTTTVSAVLAFVAAAVQPWVVSEPERDVVRFVLLWAAVAGISILIVGVEIVVRMRRTHSPLQRELSLVAVEQFAPAVIVGGLLTYAILQYAAASASLIPSLWTLLFSLGIFSSRRTLPRATMWVAGYYALAGLYLIARHGLALQPFAMGGVFGVGQLMAAGVLFGSLEWNRQSHE